MIRDVFWELKPDYQEIDIRSSMLNADINPSPFSFTNTNSKAECLWVWDMVHHIMQNTMLIGLDSWYNIANECKLLLSNMQPYERNELKFVESNLFEYAHIAQQFTDEYWMIDAMETKYQTMIECSWYLVTFSWTMDCVIFDKDWAPIIIDIKTSWSKRDDFKAESQRQKYYYAYLYNTVRRQRKPIKFIYLVVTKQKKIQKQIFEFEITYEEAERITKADLRSYLTHHTTNNSTSLPQNDVYEKEIWYEYSDTSV
jgi:hypothetical protein